MSFTLLYFTSLLLPGYLLARLFKLQTQLLLYCVSFSLFYFTFNLFIALLFRLNVASISLVYCSGIVLLLAAMLLAKHKQANIKIIHGTGYLIVALCSGIYLLTIGMYDEVPSDLYKHLENFKQASFWIETNELRSLAGLSIFSKNALYWYHLPTLISNHLNIQFVEHLEFYSAINVILLLTCIYGFTHWLFEHEKLAKPELFVLCLLSVFFFVTHFGINVFSYIRYYSTAPTILNYVVYLTSIVCLFGYLRAEISLVKFAVISSILCFTAFLLHAQEAMFIVTMYVIVIFVVVINSKLFKNKIYYKNNSITLPNSLIPLTIVTSLIGVLFYFYVVSSQPLARIIPPKVISLAALFGVGNESFILNPLRQFYTVVTHWGLWVAALYIIFYRRFFSQQPIILAAMLVPVVTVFNPVFTNFFLRIAYSDVLWRLLYMLPLYLIAARLVAGLLFYKTANFNARILNYSIILATFIILMPIQLGHVNLPYSRVYSLVKPHSQAVPEYWQDMLDFLNQLPEKETIITDPVTGYMLTALTKHNNRRYKFYVRKMRDNYYFENYKNHPLSKYNGKLFILNLRGGMSTSVAKISRHWNPRTMNLSEYYNDSLIEHLNAETSHFELLWQADDIKIYRINY